VPLRLGLLSLAESAASTDGALISSLSIPFFALACGALLPRVVCRFLGPDACFVMSATAALVLIPDQNLFLTVVQDALAASLLAGSAGLFVGGFLVNALNE
jgi:hypothetical protein